jgi:hypothetical protein
MPAENRRTSKSERGRLLVLNAKALARSIEAIEQDKEPYSYSDTAPDLKPLDRWAAIAALRAVMKFLHSHRVNSAVLFQLILDLEAVDNPGETRAIFKPSRKSGRKPDDKIVQGLKGKFAGMAYAQMHVGMSREHAVSWTARNIPPGLALRVSTKPIRSSTIVEWMKQYGCNARIRRGLKSATTQNGVEQFLLKNIKFDHTARGYGKKECLRMLRVGYECRAVNKPIPFSGIFDFLQNKFVLTILADWDTELGKSAPCYP